MLNFANRTAYMLSDLSAFASVSTVGEQDVLFLKGAWLISDIGKLELLAKNLSELSSDITQVDASEISAMDTAGAYFLYVIEQQLRRSSPNLTLDKLASKFSSMLQLVSMGMTGIAKESRLPVKNRSFFTLIGFKVVSFFEQMLGYFTFLGELTVRFLIGLCHPLKIQWRSFLNEIDIAGFRALGIIAVMMFLIGVVLAYQMGVELRVYGANIYVVNVTGIAILREFSPLIASVIIAGRTSTSYAALLGTMKVNEEVDALKTMGLSPIDRLVLPKVLGLLVALPLLVVWGDAFGLLGSMVMSKSVLGMGYMVFLQRLKMVVAVKHLYLGLLKTPVFALIISGVGCYQGLQAEGSAQSVGLRTTKAAVQSIFLIILADALFSILFNWLNV